jgi:hypothetical protein
MATGWLQAWKTTDWMLTLTPNWLQGCYKLATYLTYLLDWKADSKLTTTNTKKWLLKVDLVWQNGYRFTHQQVDSKTDPKLAPNWLQGLLQADKRLIDYYNKSSLSLTKKGWLTAKSWMNECLPTLTLPPQPTTTAIDRWTSGLPCKQEYDSAIDRWWMTTLLID